MRGILFCVSNSSREVESPGGAGRPGGQRGGLPGGQGERCRGNDGGVHQRQQHRLRDPLHPNRGGSAPRIQLRRVLRRASNTLTPTPLKSRVGSYPSSIQLPTRPANQIDSYETSCWRGISELSHRPSASPPIPTHYCTSLHGNERTEEEKKNHTRSAYQCYVFRCFLIIDLLLLRK